MSCFQTLPKDIQDGIAREVEADPAACLQVSRGNSKLRKTSEYIRDHITDPGMQWLADRIGDRYRIASFNLPAGGYGWYVQGVLTMILVCIGALHCLHLCYARQGRYTYTAAARVRVRNHRALLALGRSVQDVANALLRAISRLPRSVGIIRLHDSGDLYSLAYLQAWILVARQRPDLVFYLFTKSVLLFLRIRDELPENFVVTFSEGGKWDDRIPEYARRSIIFGSSESMQAHRPIVIDGNDPKRGDLPAILPIAVQPYHIGLVYHGSRGTKHERTQRGLVGIRSARDRQVAEQEEQEEERILEDWRVQGLRDGVDYLTDSMHAYRGQQ